MIIIFCFVTLEIASIYLQREGVLFYTVCHVSTVAQNGQTKHELEPCTVFMSFIPTLGSSTSLEGLGFEILTCGMVAV